MTTTIHTSALPMASSSKTRLDSGRIKMTSTRAFTTPDPPRQIIVDRSFSSRSDVSTSSDKSRHWTPATQSIPLSSIEGKEGKGGMMGKSYLGEAERGLSSLFAENERKAGSKSVKSSTRKDKTWGGSLVNGAKSATIFGAALGLTAYRLWSGNNPPQTPKDTHPLSISPATSSSVRSRPDSIQFPPPPAYTELLHPQTLNNPSSPSSRPPPIDSPEEDEESWVDIRDGLPSPISYIKSSRISPIHTMKFSRHRSRGSKSSLRRMRVIERRMVDISIQDIETPPRRRFYDLFEPNSPNPSSTPKSPSRIQYETPVKEVRTRMSNTEGHDDVTDDVDDVDPREIMQRLDKMGDVLSRMIEEGKRALAAPSPVLASEGWVTESTKMTNVSGPKKSHGKSDSVSFAPMVKASKGSPKIDMSPTERKKVKRRSINFSSGR